MANQVEIVSEGYNQNVTQVVQFATDQIVAGTASLLAKGSTEGFGACCTPSGVIYMTDPASISL